MDVAEPTKIGLQQFLLDECEISDVTFDELANLR